MNYEPWVCLAIGLTATAALVWSLKDLWQPDESAGDAAPPAEPAPSEESVECAARGSEALR